MYTATNVDKRTAVIFASVVTFVMGSMIFIAGVSTTILPAIICGSLISLLSTISLGYIVWTHVSEEPASTQLIGN